MTETLRVERIGEGLNLKRFFKEREERVAKRRFKEAKGLLKHARNWKRHFKDAWTAYYFYKEQADLTCVWSNPNGDNEQYERAMLQVMDYLWSK